MHKITCIENKKLKNQDLCSLFAIEPLEVGQSITIGNSLRRTLLSDLSSYAITSVRINDIEHEFTVLSCIREDVLEVLLHLKDIVFRPSLYTKNREDKAFKAVLNVQGPVIVTAGMFALPYKYLSIVNPNQYICTIIDDSDLYIELEIEKGKAYRLVDENRRLKKPKGRESKGRALFVDSLFMPVRKVNYKVKLIHDTKGNIKESLLLEITTNGSMTPKRALLESLKLLLDLFAPLLVDNSFLTFSQDLIKNNL